CWLTGEVMPTIRYGTWAGPICGERTGLAMPKNTTPWPPPRIDSASSTLSSAAGWYCQLLLVTQTSRADADVDLHLLAAADIAAGRRDGVAGLETGRAGLGAEAAQLHDPRRRVGQVGNPDVVIVVDG